ncbi:MAG: hypothetical protein C4289_00575 [Chloroflexota bacterium]
MIVVVMLVPRLLALDRLVVVDETFWLGRSANFYKALASGDFADTYQFVHPGVPLMWFGTLGYMLSYPTYPSEQESQLSPVRPPIVETLRRLGHDPLQMLIAERRIKILGDTLILLIAFWMATRVLGLGVAVLGFCLLALEPFVIAHARLLHVDALVSSFMMLSVLALLAYQRCGNRRRDLVISGMAAGLAWLTRSPALILIPYTGLMFLLDFWLNRRGERRFMHGLLRPLLQTFLLWFTAAATVTFALWPALWVQPVDTATSIIEWAYDAATEGHERSTFFLGKIIANGDPGWLFYPVSYLWRATPVTQLGLLLAVLGLALCRTRIIPPSLRRPLVQLLLFALLFMACMSLGAKKFDRYILPSYLPLNLVAAAGWYGVLRTARRARFHLAPIIALAIAGLIMVAQGLSAISAYPYYLSYYNPLLGGTRSADRAVLVGWGEGMDQVASFIKAQPDGADAVVRTDAWREPLIFYLPNTIYTDIFPPNDDGKRRWMHTDYFVTYVTMWQRDTVSPALQHYLDQQRPVLTVTIDGLVYARVYDLRRIPVPEWYFHG